MAEQNPLVRRHEVAAIVQSLSRRRSLRVELEDLVGDEPRVKAVCDEIRAHRGDDEPSRTDGFTAGESDVTKRSGTEDRYTDPDECAQKSRHGSAPHSLLLKGAGLPSRSHEGKDRGLTAPNASLSPGHSGVRHDALSVGPSEQSPDDGPRWMPTGKRGAGPVCVQASGTLTTAARRERGRGRERNTGCPREGRVTWSPNQNPHAESPSATLCSFLLCRSMPYSRRRRNNHERCVPTWKDRVPVPGPIQLSDSDRSRRRRCRPARIHPPL